MDGWARAVAVGRTVKAVPFDFIGEVVDQTALLDEESDREESASCSAAAMALMLQDQDLEVCVVTEDRQPLPTRCAMTEACDALLLPHAGVRDLLVAAGCANLLRA